MDHPPSPPPFIPRRPWRMILAWVVVLGCVAVVVGVNGRKNHALPAEDQTDPPPNLALKMSARYSVGLAGLQEASASRQALVQKLLPQLQAHVHTPADRLRVVMVQSQLTNPQAAGQALSALGAQILQPDTWQDADTLRLLFGKGSAAVPAELRQRLLDRYGWYAQLALTSDLPADHPDRRAALKPAIRGAVGAIALFTLAGAAILAGIGLLIALAVRVYSGQKPSTAFIPMAWDGGFFLEAMAIYLLGMLLLPLAVRQWWPNVGLNGTWLMAPVVALAIAWPIIRGLPWSLVRRQLGWTAGRGFWREVGAGILGYCAAMPVLVLGIFATMALSRYSRINPSHPIIHQATGGAGQIVAMYLLACLWAPITEETLFRGALYQHLRGRWNGLISAVVVGLIFAALHPQGWVAIPILGTIGAILAIIREWRNSLIASMTAHALINGLTVTLLVLLLN